MTRYNDAASFLAGIYAREKEREPKGDEFRGEDGLIRCRECGKPRQSAQGGYLHPVGCECEEKREKEAMEERERERHEKEVKRLRGECFGDERKRFRDATFDGSDPGINPSIMERCRAYCRDYRLIRENELDFGYFFYGKPGRGKTHAASCICNELIEKYETSVRFESESSIIARCFNSTERADYLDRLVRYDLLVIDDLGVRSTRLNGEPNGYLQFIEELINRRYESLKPVIVTSNLPLNRPDPGGRSPEMQRISSRLSEITRPIDFTGEDLRGGKGAERFRRFGETLREAR